MPLSVTGDEVDKILRKLLSRKGYRVKNEPRRRGETGADIIAERRDVTIAIECIGFQENPPLRSKQFYEAFFRAISRIKDGAKRCIMALPSRFGRGLTRRAEQYGEAWARIGQAFPELEIWLVDVDKEEFKIHHWSDWPDKKREKESNWLPQTNTIGHLVFTCLSANPNAAYEDILKKVQSCFPSSRFNKKHFSWYKWKMRSSSGL